MPTTGYFLNQYFTTTLNVGGGINNSQTTGIIISNVSGIDTTKPGIALINYADPLNTSIAEWVTYTSIDGSKELQGVTRGAEGYSAKPHDNGVSVAFPLSESHINNLATALSIGGNATNLVTTTIDDDTMATATATSISSSESIKAYVDNYGQYNSLFRQAIINGNFDVSQRGTTFVAGANNDDVYTLDRWNLISDGNDILDVSQDSVTDLPGSNYAIKLDVETAKRAGIVQFLEAKDAQKFKGKNVSISFAVKSANISAIRATVLSWSSTADSITSDVVGTWAATPTWATNWADNATPADLTVTSSWTTVKVENIAIDESTVNNLALVIWLPNEETIGDIVYISQVQMNMGSVALPFQPKSYEEELRACQRYANKINIPVAYGAFAIGWAESATLGQFVIPTNVTMRTTPALATSGTFRILNSGAIDVASFDLIGYASTYAQVRTTVATGLVAGQTLVLQNKNNTAAYLLLTSEL